MDNSENDSVDISDNEFQAIKEAVRKAMPVAKTPKTLGAKGKKPVVAKGTFGEGPKEPSEIAKKRAELKMLSKKAKLERLDEEIANAKKLLESKKPDPPKDSVEPKVEPKLEPKLEEAKPAKKKKVITISDSEEDEPPVIIVKKKSKQKKRVIYIDSSEDEEDAPVIIKKKKKVPKEALLASSDISLEGDELKKEIISREVNKKVDTMKNELLAEYMNGFFPR